MAISYLQSASNAAGSGTQPTLVITFSQPTAAGSTIILASNTVFSNAVISGVTDNGSIASTYKRRAFAADLEMYTASNVVAGITQITVSFSYTNPSTLLVMTAEYAGAIALGQRVDVNGGATGNPSNSMTIHGPNNWVVSMIMLAGNNTFTAQNGTLRNQDPSTNTIGLVDNTSAVSGTSLTTSVTASPGGGFFEICTIELSANPTTLIQALAFPGVSSTATYTGEQTAGSGNVVAIFWGEAITITSVTDTSGNTYADCGAGQLQRGGGGGGNNFLQVFVAVNIKAAGFNSNAVTFHFSPPPSFANDVYISEYSSVNSVDSSSTGVSTTATATTGSNLTSVANEVAVAFGVFNPTQNPSPGTGYVLATAANASGRGEILEDKFVASSGTSTSASATSAGSTSSGIIMTLLQPSATPPPPVTGSGGSGMVGEMLSIGRYCSRMWP